MAKRTAATAARREDSARAPVSSLGILEYVWAPDGSRVAYRTDLIEPGRLEVLVSYPSTEYGTTPVSPPIRYGDGVREGIEWTHDSEQVVYRAETMGLDRIELFASSRDGSRVTLLSGPLVVGGQVSDFELR